MSSSSAVSVIMLDLSLYSSSKPKRPLMDLILCSSKTAHSCIKDILISSQVLK